MSKRRRSLNRNGHGKRRLSRRHSRLWGVMLSILLPLGATVLSILVWSRLPGPGSDVHTLLVVVSAEPTPLIGNQLRDAGLIKQPFLFDAFFRLTGGSNRFVPGPHLLRNGMTPRDLAACLTRASNRPKVQLTIPEGFDQFRIARRLDSLGICASRDFLAAAQAPDLLKELGIVGKTVEGYLCPLTYSLAVDSEPRALITNWVTETRRRIEKLNQLHDQALTRLRNQRAWGEYEVLTLASIIEKETNHDDERPIIAGIFFNRLDDPDFRPKRMLQSDPTALYGCLAMPSQILTCTGHGGKVNPAMLRDTQNPYNTYRHPGLPPGPISNPGEASIAAVLSPTQTDYLFFFAKNGRHVFSRTLAEHEAVIHDLSN